MKIRTSLRILSLQNFKNGLECFVLTLLKAPGGWYPLQIFLPLLALPDRCEYAFSYVESQKVRLRQQARFE